MESLRDEDEVNSSLGLPSPPPAPTSAERGNQAATGAALSVAEKRLFFRDSLIPDRRDSPVVDKGAKPEARL